MDFRSYYRRKKKLVEKHLKAAFKGAAIPPAIRRAMDYSLLGGGKRIRPVLCLMADDAVRGSFGANTHDIITLALPLEMIHTYSLIHDDLPAMDDDDLRRGRPTSHKKFDEATAILAGDGLLTFAFEYLGRIKDSIRLPALLSELGGSAGVSGMVGGQVLDMAGTGKNISLAALKKIHAMKTGALIRASVMLPVIYRGLKKSQADYFRRYSEEIGLLFQIIDDILDVTSTDAELGKPAGSDDRNDKSTYVSLLGMEKASLYAGNTLKNAHKLLDKLPFDCRYLHELAAYIYSRKN